MISLLLSLAVLLVGYLVYGRLTEKVFAPDDRQTPAIAVNDGVDCVPMKPWKAYLVQLLNIAGTGPIFGPLMGAVFGPVVFLWIVLGSILGGAVHDYMSGMISSRYGGSSIAELSGAVLGKAVRWIMRVFSVVLLVLCGVVFVTSPAGLLDKLTPDWMNGTFWAVLILAYYLLATLLPIDKVIGKLYPVFGVLLVTMAAAVIGGIIFSGGRFTIPEISLANLHPEGTPVWPPMLYGIFYEDINHAADGGLYAELIRNRSFEDGPRFGAPADMQGWSTYAAAPSLLTARLIQPSKKTQLLNDALANGASNVVYEISTGVLGTFGGILAIVGVIVCPITSGDTAFRSARLILAETFKLDQKPIRNRLLITVPLLVIGGLLTWFAVTNNNGFQIVWRYFSWSNQTLAMISLWMATAYLVRFGKKKYGSLLTAMPAAFMSAVSLTYILMANEGFGLSSSVAYPAGIVFAAALFGVYVYMWRKPALRK